VKNASFDAKDSLSPYNSFQDRDVATIIDGLNALGLTTATVSHQVPFMEVKGRRFRDPKLLAQPSCDVEPLPRHPGGVGAFSCIRSSRRNSTLRAP
jgi:hypothetical protein